MRRISKKAAGWGSALLMAVVLIVVGFLAPVAIHVATPQWEAPVIFGSLATSLALFGVAGQAHARGAALPTLNVSAIALLLMCGTLAGVHGWGLAVAILGPLAGLGLTIFARSLIGRPVRQALALDDEEAATVREPYMPPPTVLPGQATEIWASRAKVRAIIATQLVLLFISGCIVWLVTRERPVPPQNVSIVVVCAVGTVYALAELATAARMLMGRRPAVVLTADGFIDNATLGASGMGYIRWREVMGLMPFGKRAGRRLLVMVIDPEPVRGRLSWWQRLQLAVVSASVLELSPVAIPERVLPMRVEELQEQMERRIEAAGATIQ